MLCSYGCGKEDIKQFKNGNWCCSRNVSLCTAIIKKVSDSKIGEKNVMKRKEVVDKMIKTQIKNGTLGWPGKRTNEYKQKISFINKGQISRTKGKKGIYTKETLKKMSVSRINLYKDPKYISRIRKQLVESGKWLDESLFPDYIIYRKRVWFYTRISMMEKFSSDELKTIGRRKNSGKNHIDHIFSCMEGFKLGIIPKIIGCKSNIRLLEVSENVRKSSRCDISLEKLFELYDSEQKISQKNFKMKEELTQSNGLILPSYFLFYNSKFFC